MIYLKKIINFYKFIRIMFFLLKLFFKLLITGELFTIMQKVFIKQKLYYLYGMLLLVSVKLIKVFKHKTWSFRIKLKEHTNRKNINCIFNK